MESLCCVRRSCGGIVGKTVSLLGICRSHTEEAEESQSSTFPLSLRPSSKSSGEHTDVVPAFLVLKLTPPSRQNAALLRLPGAYPRSLQAQIQACVVLSSLSRPFWLTSDLQRRVSSNSRHTSSTSGSVISSISRPTEPSRRVCHTNTTTGTSRDLASYHTRFTRRYSRTGIVYNVTPRAVGVIINKIVGNRYIEKRVNIRVEHIRHSGCRQEFLDRVKRNTAVSAEAKKSGGTSISTLLSENPSDLLVQSVLPSNGYQHSLAPAIPSRQCKVLRRSSPFLTRLPFDSCTGTVCMQSNRIRMLWFGSVRKAYGE